MNIQLISLLVLIAAIALGFIRKTNVGLIAILAVTVFSTFIGVSDSEIIKGFSTSLFIMLLGVSFLCTIGITNGSLELLAKKALKLSGGYTIIVPFILYIIGFVLSAIGPGCVPAAGIISALALPLAKATGYSAPMLAIIGEFGAFSGRFSPITPELALLGELTEPQNISGYENGLLIYSTITTVVLSVLVYLYYTAVRKIRPSSSRIPKEILPKFTGKQLITIGAFIVVIICTAFFSRNIGLIAFAAGVILILLGAADEKQVFKSVSWSTLILVTGFGMLMNVVIQVGGVDMLSGAMASIMSPSTATPIQGLTAGIMSWFSSAIGVVWPTLIPTVGSVAETVGVAPSGLITIMCITATLAGLSPASTGGGLIMASAATDPEFTKEKENRLFIELFAISVISVLLTVAVSFLGVYSII